VKEEKTKGRRKKKGQRKIMNKNNENKDKYGGK
jgi:hypothetical protein